MVEAFLLVDFENVREVTLSLLPDAWRVKIFIGRSQNSVPFTIASEAQQLGDRLEWIKISGDGRNNLDFHLAFHLGRLTAEFPAAEFVILSQDKGFDALLKHTLAGNIQCRRINDFAEIAVRPAEAEDPQFARAFAVLSKIEKKSRPRKRKTLTQHIASMFQKKLSADENERIVAAFFAKGLITETDHSLTYDF